MEDKRIAKTKKNLKNAMIAMLGEKISNISRSRNCVGLRR